MTYKKYLKKLTTCLLLALCMSMTCFASSIDTSHKNYHNKCFLFVSLGMPINTLSQYLVQAKQYHIPVLIRGLYTQKNDAITDKTVGSFDDTANRIFKILKNEDENKKDITELKKSMGGVSINPLLFRSFSIRVVPALVITDDQSDCVTKSHSKNEHVLCPKSNFDVVYGNIPIYKQLKIISEKTTNVERKSIVLGILNLYSQNEHYKNE